MLVTPESLLEEIKERIEILIYLNIPPFGKEKYGVKDGTQLRVLKLCDMRYTIQDMSTELKATKKAISRAIEKLMKKGFIRSLKIKDKTVYVRAV